MWDRSIGGPSPSPPRHRDCWKPRSPTILHQLALWGIGAQISAERGSAHLPSGESPIHGPRRCSTPASTLATIVTSGGQGYNVTSLLGSSECPFQPGISALFKTRRSPLRKNFCPCPITTPGSHFSNGGLPNQIAGHRMERRTRSRRANYQSQRFQPCRYPGQPLRCGS